MMAKKESILIADDDKVFVTMTSDFLHKQGFNVMVAFDAMQALMRTRQTAPDAVIMDVNMPGGTGVEALRKLRMMSGTARTPVLVVTGSTDTRIAEEVLGIGADEVLKKPVELENLHAAIRRVLDRDD